MHEINYGERKVHAFDVDGTILPGELIERAYAKLKEYDYLNLSNYDMDHIDNLKNINQDEYIEQIIKSFTNGIKGLSVKNIHEIAKKIAHDDVLNVYPEILKIIDNIHKSNDDIVLLSAAPRIFVKELGHEIGATVSDGTHYFTRRGYIDLYRGKKAFLEKDKHLDSICRSLGACAIAAYGNSMSDYFMLKSVTHPVAVNPVPELRKKAEQQSWDIIDCNVYA